MRRLQEEVSSQLIQVTCKKLITSETKKECQDESKETIPMASTPSTSGTTSPASSSNGLQLMGQLGASGSGNPPTDLSIKYHKLATEYAKLRTQFGVVKKAVVEEQGKTADLQETIRIKEVKERKWESEMESLNFRNDQLTKRIQVTKGRQTF